ncbi:MAG TPA: hypothetical protein ENN34_12040 [Deltaproteobacteria bacterium]|nr:hypothetical protein [Deltaproteobacteria bacterium]
MDVFLKSFYNNRVAHVDLNTSRVEFMPVPPGMLSEAIGGAGVTRLLHEHFAGQDPIVLGCGPLTGSFAPASCLMVATFSPDTKTLIHVPFLVNSGPQLKFSGFDFLVITGQSPEPVMLEVMNDAVKISGAGMLEGEISRRERTLMSRGRFCPEAILLTGEAARNGVGSAVLSLGQWGSLDKEGLGSYAEKKNIRAITLLASGGIAFPGENLEQGSILMKELRARYKKRQYVVQDFMAGGQAHRKLIRKHFRKSHACFHCPLACISYLEFTSRNGGKKRTGGVFLMDHEGFAALAALRPLDACTLMHACIEQGLDPLRAASLIGAEAPTEDALKTIREGLPGSRSTGTGPAPGSDVVPDEVFMAFGTGIPRIRPQAPDASWQSRVGLAMILGICPILLLTYPDLSPDHLLSFISPDAGFRDDLHQRIRSALNSIAP